MLKYVTERTIQLFKTRCEVRNTPNTMKLIRQGRVHLFVVLERSESDAMTSQTTPRSNRFNGGNSPTLLGTFQWPSVCIHYDVKGAENLPVTFRVRETVKAGNHNEHLNTYQSEALSVP